MCLKPARYWKVYLRASIGATGLFICTCVLGMYALAATNNFYIAGGLMVMNIVGNMMFWTEMCLARKPKVN